MVQSYDKKAEYGSVWCLFWFWVFFCFFCRVVLSGGLLFGPKETLFDPERFGCLYCCVLDCSVFS